MLVHPEDPDPIKADRIVDQQLLPGVDTGVLTVCHDAPSDAATRAIDMRSMTTDFSAQSTADLLSLDRGVGDELVSWRHTCPHPGHR